MAQHEHRAKDRVQRREHAESIAQSGLKPVSLLEVNTALVMLARSTLDLESTGRAATRSRVQTGLRLRNPARLTLPRSKLA